MYDLKTLLPEFDIKLPTCMYALKNVSLSANADAASDVAASSDLACIKSKGNLAAVNQLNGSSSTCALDLDKLSTQIQHILKNSNEAAILIERQKKVLQQLEELKAQMARIRTTLGLCDKGIKHTAAQQSVHHIGLREEPLNDMVINSHPRFIPYALLALKNVWQNLFTINVQTFTHSTLTDIGSAAKEFETNLQGVPVDETKPKINVTLIWKNCEHTEMISSPTMYVPIYGEVNIIRYLGRVGPVEYRYEGSMLCNEIDLVLDICYELLRCNAAKSRASKLRDLSNRLQKQQYFAGEQITVADIGVYSSLLRIPNITDKELTPTLLEWRKRIKLVTKI